MISTMATTKLRRKSKLRFAAQYGNCLQPMTLRAYFNLEYLSIMGAKPAYPAKKLKAIKKVFPTRTLAVVYQTLPLGSFYTRVTPAPTNTRATGKIKPNTSFLPLSP